MTTYDSHNHINWLAVNKLYEEIYLFAKAILQHVARADKPATLQTS